MVSEDYCEVAYYYTKTVKRESDLLQSGQKRELAEPSTWRYLVGLFVFVFSLLLNYPPFFWLNCKYLNEYLNT